MLTSRISVYFSSHRFPHLLLLKNTSVLSNHRQYNQDVQSQLNQFLAQHQSWKLTHQPREPKLHWSSRFRPRQEFEIEENSSTDNWDSWFDQKPSTFVSFSTDPLDFLQLPLPMPKRPRDSSVSLPSTEREYKREKHQHHYHWNLPKRLWSKTNYDERLATSHHEHFCFQLICYNILAQKLIEDNSFLYDRCHDDHLDWHQRKDRLLREILHQDADIVCLQEMQHEHYLRDFQPRMNRHGYDSIYIKRSGDKSDGCCLFYKVDRLRLMNSKTVPFYQRNIELLDRDNCGLVALFQPNTPTATAADIFCVATTHLLFSPKRGDIKLAQIQYFLAEIDRMSLKDPQLNTYYPIIICGDFNAQPQSPLSKFLVDGHIQYNSYRRIEISGQMPQSLVNHRFSLPLPSNELLPSSFVTSECRFPPSIHRTSSARLTHNKQFHSVYDLHDVEKVTTRIDNETNLVDYIFYTQQNNDRHRLNLLSRFDLYDQHQMSHIHLPNHQFASDHFLLAAKFALKLHQKKKSKKKKIH